MCAPICHFRQSKTGKSQRQLSGAPVKIDCFSAYVTQHTAGLKKRDGDVRRAARSLKTDSRRRTTLPCSRCTTRSMARLTLIQELVFRNGQPYQSPNNKSRARGGGGWLMNYCSAIIISREQSECLKTRGKT